ncbi:MAG: AraC family transcriptional regulator [Catenulispora sp. 13_1_20CM_3_70_7]|nr:helix-turn-helix transcriptional regulator [Catenulisporales bacterium]OLE20809.1 MAG: AraC family transcriptional regulator [Catenulispora sp. 13_1_20CM_3_70_7]
MQIAVERAIEIMWDRYNEPLSLSDMADAAILSRFHFSRVFRSLTGTSPCRFLAAVRLAKAKDILLQSSMNVTDIAYEVGYNSLGTFTSRFTRSVGVSPGRYRQLSATGMPAPLPIVVPGARGVVRGLVALPDTDVPLRVYIGAFDSPIAQGMPVACDVLDSPGPFRLDGVPDGHWYVRAAAVPMRDVDPRPWARKPLFVGAIEPVVGRRGVVDADVELHPVGPLDLPVLVALPELDGSALPVATGEQDDLDREAAGLVPLRRFA